MKTNRARLQHSTPFGADAMFGEDMHPFFRTVKADQGHACPTLVVRNWCCSRKAGYWCFPPTGKVQKKGNKKKRKEKNFVRADCEFRAKESTISKPKTLRPFPFLCAFFEHVEVSTSPNLGFALCLYFDKLSLRQATPRRFWLSKTDLKMALWAH